MGLDMVGSALTPLLCALMVLVGACLIHFTRPRPSPVLVAVRHDGKLVELPVADGP